MLGFVHQVFAEGFILIETFRGKKLQGLKVEPRSLEEDKGSQSFNLFLCVSSSLPAFVVLIYNPDGLKLYF